MASKKTATPAQKPTVVTHTEPAAEKTTMKTTIKGAATTTAPAATALAAPKLVEQAETPIKEMLNMDKAIKTAEEFVSFGQGNVEAVMKSSQIWAAGVQDLGKHLAATAQAQMDETMATVKALSTVKSVKEAVELQTALAKTAMEKLMAETGKLTDASMKLAEQAFAPITERVTLATEKFGRPVA
jgi:phasin family protein